MAHLPGYHIDWMFARCEHHRGEGVSRLVGLPVFDLGRLESASPYDADRGVACPSLAIPRVLEHLVTGQEGMGLLGLERVQGRSMRLTSR